jgi:hypothetical protein
MADTAAALVIQLSADFKQFQKEMRAATGTFDAEGRKIERRQSQLKKNLSNWSGIGKGLSGVLVGGAAIAGIQKFVSSIVEAASALQDTSDAIGVGTDELQSWGLLAERASIKQETFNSALEKFSKTIGDASIKGGPALKFFQALGVNVKGGTTQAFYQFADAVAKTGSVQQQNSLVTTAFGKKMANLTPILAEGSKALKDQVAQFSASGQIIQRDAIPKIDALGDAWSDLKRQFVATGANSLAEPLSDLTKALSDPAVQDGIKTFAKLLAEIAVQLAKAAKYAPILAGAFAGAKIGGRILGPEGAIGGALIGGIAGGSLGGVNTQTNDQIQKRIAALKQSDPSSKVSATQAEIKRLQGIIAQRPVAAPTPPPTAPGKPTGGGLDRSDLTGEDALKRQEGARQLTEMQIADAKSVRDATVRANEDIRDSDLDAFQSRQDSIKAQDDALLSLTQGTDQYYTLAKQVIIELANLDIEYTKKRNDNAITGLAERLAAEEQEAADERTARKTQLDLLVSQDKVSRKAANQSLAEFDDSQTQEKAVRDKAAADQRITLEQDTASQIKGINAKKNADLAAQDEEFTQARARAIQITDTLRGGLEDIGAAALHGFGSMKDAAKAALEQIAEMILRLYVLKPLLDGLFGKQGTIGGGLLGGAGGAFNGTGLFNGIANIFGAGNLAANTTAAIAANPLLFDDGGYTGPGGKKKPAGIVHAGEGVLSQDDIRALGGPSGFAALRSALKNGYSTGGLVGTIPSAAPSLPRAMSPSRSGPSIAFHVDARGASKGTAEEIRDQLMEISPAIVRAAVSESNRQFPSNLSTTLRDRG